MSESSLEPLLANTISGIRITGIVHSQDVTLSRRFAPPDLVPPMVTDIFEDDYTVVPRVVVDLPPPGEAQLCLSIDGAKPLGHGGTGYVYDLKVSGGADKYHVPPLVIKLARKTRRAHLAREAWFYDELACLQGVTVARCYGWFEAELAPGDTVIPWATDCEDELGENDAYILQHTWGPALCELGAARNVISVLLLEKLDQKVGRIPRGVKLPQEFRERIYDTFHETANVGVDVRDIRYQNILCAPDDQFPGHLPSLPSPFTSRTYSWRIIDLEGCEKNNWPIEATRDEMGSWLEAIMDSMEEGWLLDPSMVT